MHISILGAGHAGTAVAADLSIRGHSVTLIKTSNAMHDENFNYLLEHNGAVKLIENGQTKQGHITQVTRDVSKISQSDIIIIYIQSNYHEDLIKRIKPYLRDGQTLLINPGYLSTAYVLKHCSGINLTVVEAQSSFIDCRISEPGTVTVSFRNKRNPIGIYPASHSQASKKKLEQLGYSFTYLSSVIEAALHNPNLIVHTIGGIMSIPRVEKMNGNYFMYREVFTPSVWRILEALDKEKMDVMEMLGFERISYLEACKFRNSTDDSLDAKDVFFSYANMPNPLQGPLEVDSRFISEDVPQGLVLLESLGLENKVPTPICTSLIEVASAALERDLRVEGRTIKRLGEQSLQQILKEVSEDQYV